MRLARLLQLLSVSVSCFCVLRRVIAPLLAPDRSLAARDLVNKLLGMLKPVERLVIDMLYLQARSVAEVQKLTGWSAATVKIRAFRARQKLRKQIGGLL